MSAFVKQMTAVPTAHASTPMEDSSASATGDIQVRHLDDLIDPLPSLDIKFDCFLTTSGD
jgi:hypothetical protein